MLGEVGKSRRDIATDEVEVFIQAEGWYEREVGGNGSVEGGEIWDEECGGKGKEQRGELLGKMGLRYGAVGVKDAYQNIKFSLSKMVGEGWGAGAAMSEQGLTEK